MVIWRSMGYCHKSRKRLVGSGNWQTKLTKDQVEIYKCTLQNCSEKRSNLRLVLVDYKNAYGMVPLSWMAISTMEMVQLANISIHLIKQSMNKWKTKLHADGKLLGSVPIKKEIWLGDSLS